MNYRIGPRPQPVKQLQLRPGSLGVKYPSSLRPSPLRAWCWETVLAAETVSRSFVAWLHRQIRIGWQIMKDALLRLELRERMKECGVWVGGWLAQGVKLLWLGLVHLTKVGLTSAWSGIRMAISWLRSQQRDFQAKNQSGGNLAISTFDASLAEFRVRQLSSPSEQAFRRELAKSHAQLAEQLLTAEEELARATTRVAHLRNLILAQEVLLVEMTRGEENLAERNQSFEASVDHLVAVGRTSGREKPRNLPLFRRN
jgi:hypothetical protein